MKKIEAIPSQSRYALAVDGRGEVAIRTRETPVPGKNEILVKMACAPVNPSDMVQINNYSASKRSYPNPAGREGAGLVVGAGEGLFPALLLGRRVAVASGEGGTWADYTIAKATSCAPLRKDLSYEQGCMVLINPLTAYAIIGYAKKHGHTALINTASAGPFGKMIRNYARRRGIKVINTVRRSSQIEQLRSEGETYVLDSSDPAFVSNLKHLAHQINATLSLDAIGGSLTGQLIEASPQESTVLVYGGLSLEKPTASSFDLISGHKRIEGFFLGNWTRAVGIPRLLYALAEVQKLIPTDFHTPIRKKFLLDDIQEAITTSLNHASEGKSLIVLDKEAVQI